MNRVYWPVPALCVLFVLLSACSREAGAPGHTFRISTQDGVEEAVSSSVPRFTDPLFRYEKVVELRSGEDPDATLDMPFGYVRDEEGMYYVCDTNNCRVAVFDPTGRFVRSFGQRGDGPGDLNYPTGIEYRDGHLILPHRGRTSVFTTDGELVEVRTHPQNDFRIQAMWVAQDGTRLTMSPVTERSSEAMRSGYRIVRLGTEGDTLAVFETGTVPTAHMVMAPRRVYNPRDETYSVREMPTPVDIHYGGRPGAAWLPDRQEVLVSDGIRPVIGFYGLDGSLRHIVRLDMEPERVTEAEKQAIVATYDAQVERATDTGDERSGKPSLEAARQARELLQLPETKGFFGFIVPDDRGYLWVARTAPAIVDYEKNRTDVAFRVFDPEGEYIGDSTWPPNAMGGRVMDGYLLLTALDEETGEFVPTVYRMIPAAVGLVYP